MSEAYHPEYPLPKSGPSDHWLGNDEKNNALRDAGWVEERPGEWRKVDAHSVEWMYVDPVSSESVTAEAERLTQQARHHSYGPPHLDFAKVTGMAMALWGRGPETPIEHALYMILVKIAREAYQHKRDNLVDISGYARTIEMMVEADTVK